MRELTQSDQAADTSTVGEPCPAVTPGATANPPPAENLSRPGPAPHQSDALELYKHALRQTATWVRAYEEALAALEELLNKRGLTMRQAIDELTRLLASPKSVYLQRNAALEAAKRWEAEANEWKRLCLALSDQVYHDVCWDERSDAMKEHLGAVQVKLHPDETNAEEGT